MHRHVQIARLRHLAYWLLVHGVTIHVHVVHLLSHPGGQHHLEGSLGIASSTGKCSRYPDIADATVLANGSVLMPYIR